MRVSLRTCLLASLCAGLAVACGSTPSPALSPAQVTNPPLAVTPVSGSYLPEVAPAVAVSAEPYLVVTSASPVYLRSGPSLQYAEWATLAPGHKFAVIGQVEGWWQVDTGTGSGAWVKQSVVEFTGDWTKVQYLVMPTLPPPPGPSPTPN